MIMRKIVGVKFEDSKQIYCYDSAGLRVNKNQQVIVRRGDSLGFGTIVSISQYKNKIVLPKLIRLASMSDKKRYADNKNFEKYALDVFRRQIKRYMLPVKVVDATVSFNMSKVVFCFSAEKRIDFRGLVKELVRILKLKVELRQIGVRDETKNIPSIGICGRPLCCNKFLTQFDTVSMKMAKEQGLPAHPIKVSGNCGRLLCCLKYEQDVYKQLGENMPMVGDIVSTPDGIGKVTAVNLFLQNMKVLLFENEDSEVSGANLYPADQVKKVDSSDTQ